MRALQFAVSAVIAISLIQVARSEETGRAPVRSLLEFRQQDMVPQKWDLSCGAAALATILRYQHGLNLTERDVAIGLMAREEYVAQPELIKVQQGFSLKDMKRYVGTLGMQGVGYSQMTWDDLKEMAPLITVIDNNDFPHFVVVRGVHEGNVTYADPNFGNVSTPVQEFEAIWQELPELGRVGFVVSREGEKVSAPGRLVPQLINY